MIDKMDETFTMFLKEKRKIVNQVIEVAFQMIPKHRLFPFSYAG
jgi:hypothetical protein